MNRLDLGELEALLGQPPVLRTEDTTDNGEDELDVEEAMATAMIEPIGEA